MAYARRYRRRPTTTRRARNARTARPRRSYASKKRTYRRRPMTRRKILNISSRKKRNNMLTVANTDPSGNLTPLAIKPLNINGTQTGFVLWNATAMNISRDAGLNTINDESARTAQLCYMRGLKESIRIQTSSGIPWFHRRIVFRTTNPLIASGQTFVDGSGTSNTNGMQRLQLNLTIATSSDAQATYSAVREELFRGMEGTDWNDTLTAKVDTTRVRVMYDRSRVMQSGNASGLVRLFKHWIPMNKNLMYEDDEAGESKASLYTSSEGLQGMGNCMVLDIYKPGAGSAVADQLRVETESTLYWHER
ncbi:capsid protein [Citrus Tunisia genomovirus 1a]|nr:capsid protein [Citrus Tunisia genomovirus 1c]QHT64466.1 capsid protein [Citrus Tunisia genomovirus 1a]